MPIIQSLLAMSGAHKHEIIISGNNTADYMEAPAFCRRRRKIKFEDNPTEWKQVAVGSKLKSEVKFTGCALIF